MNASAARGLPALPTAILIAAAGAVHALAMLAVARGPSTETWFVLALAGAPYACLLAGVWRKGFANVVLVAVAGLCTAFGLVLAAMAGDNGDWAPILCLLFLLPMALLALVVALVMRVWKR